MTFQFKFRCKYTYFFGIIGGIIEKIFIFAQKIDLLTQIHIELCKKKIFFGFFCQHSLLVPHPN